MLSILRPVDLPPFTDDGLLAQGAQRRRVVPRIFYTFSSTEYWARAGSLTHTNEDGTSDVPLVRRLAAVLPEPARRTRAARCRRFARRRPASFATR